jgi:uncharacterized protein with von Willebrand factor type A (vWA) domain
MKKTSRIAALTAASVATLFGAWLPPPVRKRQAEEKAARRKVRKRRREGYLVRTINEAMKRGGTPVKIRNDGVFASRFLHSSRRS